MDGTCEHENAESLVNFDYGWRGSKDRRCYEVSVCMDCGYLFNFAEQETPMTPLQIVQMFVDLQDITKSAADEIQSQAKTLYETLEGMVDRMPKVA